VIVAHLDGKDKIVVIACIQDAYASTLARRSILAPPDNLVALAVPGGIWAEWDAYPGESTLCWQVQHHDSDSDDSNATSAIVTMGSYFLYRVVDADTDLGTPVTRYFRVRAIRWLGNNNVMYSSWSSWTSGTSVTWDGRYYRENELSSADCDGLHGASLIWICDADDNFPSNVSDVELALDYIWDNVAAAGAAHVMFSATHTDTVAGAALRGHIMRGNATPAFERHDASTNHFVLVGDGADITSKAFDWDDMAAGAAADMAHDHSSAAEGDEIPLASLGSYAQGSIARGGGADWEAHDASTDGAVLVGDGADIASTLTPTLKGVHTHAANIVLDDGVGDSPHLIFINQSNDQVALYLEETGDNFVILLPDAAGGSRIEIHDSGDATVFSVNSDGNMLTEGTSIYGSNVFYEGNLMVFDADFDTYIDPSADDVLDLYIGAALDFSFTANAFNVLAGSGIVMGDGTAIGQAAGPLLTFDDANDDLEITGCNVCIGGDGSEDVLLHLQVDDLGALTMPINNTLLLEQDNNAFMNMVSGTADHVGFRMGDPDDTDIGYIVYENNNEKMVFGVNAGDRMYISAAGAMQWPDYGAGDLQTDAGGNITAVSDARQKTQIRDTEIGLAEVLQMQGKAWHYTEESGLDTEYEYQGFVADDIEKIVPNAVGQMADGMKTMSYSALLPAFATAIQELDERLEKLEAI